MTERRRAALVLMVCTALAAAACGGEVTDSADDGDRETPTTSAPGPSEPDDTEPAADAEPGAAEPSEEPGTDGADDTAEHSEEPDATDGADDTDDTDAAEEPDTDGTDEAAEPSEEHDGAPPNIFDDPRDGIFDEFQATMDRGDHPFMQVDTFCLAHDPAPDRVATDTGIGADSISLVHLRSKLEEFVSLGFAAEVGDVAEMFDTFTTVVNEQCGGVRGRMIDMHTIEVPVMGDDTDAASNAACIEAIEDLDGVILLNSTGFPGSANLCIAEDHETAFISVVSQPEEFMRRGEDRLVSVTATVEDVLGWMALDLIQRGELDGRTVGLAVGDTPGESEAVEAGLVEVLKENGIDLAVYDVLGCQGAFCTVGMQEFVQKMREQGVDVVINVLNAVSAPGLLTEMVAQGYEHGDVQFYASEFNGQAVEIVASKIVAFGGEAAGRLYNGAVIQSFLNTGAYRLEGYEPKAFNEMCNDTYGAHSPSGANYESEDRAEGTATYDMAVGVCEIMRLALRAVYDAGDNPTRAGIYASLATLGPVDSNEMLPASLWPGKTATPDVLHNLVFEYPCAQPAPFGAENICLYPIDEYRPAPD